MFLWKKEKDSLLSLLPDVRGTLIEDAPLAGMTWFGTGGNAEVLFIPKDEQDLKHFMTNRPNGVNITIIGVGSNLLIRDGGVSGIVIRLGESFSNIDVEGEFIKCGAAAIDAKIATVAQKHGIGGFEFISGIPGTIGGGIRMNAGAFGSEIKDILVSAKLIDHSGHRFEIEAKDINFGYRYSLFPKNIIITSAVLKGFRDDPVKIKAKMKDFSEKRKQNQPIGERCGGSVFKNPTGLKAWELIEKAGCKKMFENDAVVSEKHCNFIVNSGGATAKDIETLASKIKQKVKEKTGVNLELEIKIIGNEK
jgi:UDP-N-acetylmuramate dehydrogenase